MIFQQKFLVLFAFTIANANGQDLGCPDLPKLLKEYSIDSGSSSFLSSVFTQHCQKDGKLKSSGGNVGIDAVIKSIPAKFTGSYSSSSAAMTNFCKTYASESSGEFRSDSYKETISAKALDTIAQCQVLASRNFYITHNVTNAEVMNFYMRASVTHQTELNGVQATGQVECKGSQDGKQVAFDLNAQWRIPTTQSFVCVRKATNGPDGSLLYDEATITVLTNQGNYAVLWPRDERLSSLRSQQLMGDVESLRTEVRILRSELADLGTGKMINPEIAPVGYTTDIRNRGEAKCPAGTYVSGITGGTGNNGIRFVGPLCQNFKKSEQ